MFTKKCTCKEPLCLQVNQISGILECAECGKDIQAINVNNIITTLRTDFFHFMQSPPNKSWRAIRSAVEILELMCKGPENGKD